MIKNSLKTRSGAWVVVVCFLAQTLCLDAHAADVILSAKTFSPSISAESFENAILNLPAEWGRVNAKWINAAASAREPVVVHIQDAHANSDAQKNIFRILRYLESQFSDVRIGLENADGRLNPEYLSFFKQARAVDAAMVRSLTDKGELTGAELFLWKKMLQKDAGAVAAVNGIESRDLHEQNVAQYRELLKLRPEIDSLLAVLRSKLSAIASKKVSPELADFLRERSRRREGRFEFGRPAQSPDLQVYAEYLDHLSQGKLGLNLADVSRQFEFPNLIRLLSLAETEKKLGVDKGRGEWAQLVGKLNAALLTEADQSWFQAFQWIGYKNGFLNRKVARPVLKGFSEEMLPRFVFEDAVRVLKANQINPSDYPDWVQSFKLIALSAEMDVRGLLEEINQVEERLVHQLAVSEEDKRWVQKLDEFDRIEKLVRLEVGRAEYQKIENDPQAYRAIVAVSPQLLDAFQKANAFYRTAQEREAVMVRRLLELSEKRNAEKSSEVFLREKKRRTQNRKVLVLISGGFHSDGIQNLLEKKKISYATVIPAIHEIREGQYENVMAGKNADLSQWFKEKAPFEGASALLFREFLETGVPAYFKQGSANSSAEQIIDALEQNPLFARQHKYQLSGKSGQLALQINPKASRTVSLPASAAVFRTSVLQADPAAEAARSELSGSVDLISSGALFPVKVRSESRAPDFYGDLKTSGVAFGKITRPLIRDGSEFLFEFDPKNYQDAKARFDRLIDRELLPALQATQSQEEFTQIKKMVKEIQADFSRILEPQHPVGFLVRRLKKTIRDNHASAKSGTVGSGAHFGVYQQADAILYQLRVILNANHKSSLAPQEQIDAYSRAMKKQLERIKREMDAAARYSADLDVKIGNINLQIADEEKAGASEKAAALKAEKAQLRETQKKVEAQEMTLIFLKDASEHLLFDYAGVGAYAGIEKLPSDVLGKKQIEQRDKILKRMQDSGKSFQAILFEDVLSSPQPSPNAGIKIFLQGLYATRREKELLRRTDREAWDDDIYARIIPDMTALVENVIAEVGGQSTVDFDKTNQGPVVVYLDQPLGVEQWKKIEQFYGARLQGVIAVDIATSNTHWVAVAKVPVLLVNGKDAQHESPLSGEVVSIEPNESGRGAVYIQPDEDRIFETMKKLERQELLQASLRHMVPTHSSKVAVYANTEPGEEVEELKTFLMGIGLTRTEIDQVVEIVVQIKRTSLEKGNKGQESPWRSLSGELLKFFVDRYSLQIHNPGLRGKVNTFRTVDFQIDKAEDLYVWIDKKFGFDFYRDDPRKEGAAEQEDSNRGLGKEVLITQLTAFLMVQASADLNKTDLSTKLRVMFPQVRGVDDLKYLAEEVFPEAIRRAKQELIARGSDFASGESRQTHSEGTGAITTRISTQDEASRRQESEISKAVDAAFWKIEFGSMVEVLKLFDPSEKQGDGRIALDDVLGFEYEGRRLIRFLSVGMNDMELSILEKIDGVPPGTYNRDMPHLKDRFGKLEPEFVKYYKLIAEAAKRAGVPLGFCGETAGKNEFTVFGYYLKERYGVEVSRSMNPRGTAEQSFYGNRLEAALTGSNHSASFARVAIAYNEIRTLLDTDQDASSSMQRLVQGLLPKNVKDMLIDLERWQKEFKVAGGLQALIEKEFNPSNAVAGFGAFLFLKKIVERQNPEALLSKGDEVDSLDMRVIIDYLTSRKILSSAQAQILNQAYHFMKAASRVFNRELKKDKRSNLIRHGMVTPETAELFARAVAHEAPEIVSWGEGHSAAAGFKSSYDYFTQSIFNVLTGAIRDEYDEKIPATVTSAQVLETLAPEGDETPIRIILELQDRLTLYLDDHGGFKFSEGVPTIHLIGGNDFIETVAYHFARAPESILKVLEYAAKYGARIDHRTQRAILMASSQWDEADEKRLREKGGAILARILDYPGDVHYALNQLPRFNLTHFFIAQEPGVVRQVKIGQEAQTRFEQSLREQFNPAFFRVRDVFVRIQSAGPGWLTLTRHVIYSGGWSRVALPFEFREKINDLVSFVRRISDRYNSQSKEKEQVIDQIWGWLKRMPASMRRPLLDVIYVSAFARSIAKLTEVQMAVLSKDGINAPFAVVDEIYEALQIRLSARKPMPSAAALKYGRKHVANMGMQVGRGIKKFYEGSVWKSFQRRIIYNGRWQQVLDEYLEQTHFGDMPGLRAYLEDRVRDPILLGEYFSLFARRESEYYLRSLRSAELLKHILSLMYLDFLDGHSGKSGMAEPVSRARSVAFMPLSASHHHPYTVLFSELQDHPGLLALYSRVLSEHGFIITGTSQEEVSFSPKDPKKQGTFIWFSGYFPHGVDSGSAIEAIREDLDKHLQVPSVQANVVGAAMALLGYVARPTVTANALALAEQAYDNVVSMRLSPASTNANNYVSLSDERILIESHSQRSRFFEGLIWGLHKKFGKYNIEKIQYRTMADEISISLSFKDRKGNNLALAQKEEILHFIKRFLDSEKVVVEKKIHITDSVPVSAVIGAAAKATNAGLEPELKIQPVFSSPSQPAKETVVDGDVEDMGPIVLPEDGENETPAAVVGVSETVAVVSEADLGSDEADGAGTLAGLPSSKFDGEQSAGRIELFQRFQVSSTEGLHMRPSAQIVKIVTRLGIEGTVQVVSPEPSDEADIKSIMGIISTGAHKDTEIQFHLSGEAAKVREFLDWCRNGFRDDSDKPFLRSESRIEVKLKPGQTTDMPIPSSAFSGVEVSGETPESKTVLQVIRDGNGFAVFKRVGNGSWEKAGAISEDRQVFKLEAAFGRKILEVSGYFPENSEPVFHVKNQTSDQTVTVYTGQDWVFVNGKRNQGAVAETDALRVHIRLLGTAKDPPEYTIERNPESNVVTIQKYVGKNRVGQAGVYRNKNNFVFGHGEIPWEVEGNVWINTDDARTAKIHAQASIAPNGHFLIQDESYESQIPTQDRILLLNVSGEKHVFNVWWRNIPQPAPTASDEKDSGGPQAGFYDLPGADEAPTAEMPINPRSEMREFQGRVNSVLIVDDEVGVRESLRMILKPYFDREHLYFASNADEARSIIEKEQIDAAFVDYRMPGVNGAEFVHSLRAQGKNFPVAMITGSDRVAEDRAKMDVALQSLGLPHRVIGKPFDIEEIFSTLDEFAKPRSEMRVLTETEEASIRALYSKDTLFADVITQNRNHATPNFRHDIANAATVLEFIPLESNDGGLKQAYDAFSKIVRKLANMGKLGAEEVTPAKAEEFNARLADLKNLVETNKTQLENYSMIIEAIERIEGLMRIFPYLSFKDPQQVVNYDAVLLSNALNQLARAPDEKVFEQIQSFLGFVRERNLSVMYSTEKSEYQVLRDAVAAGVRDDLDNARSQNRPIAKLTGNSDQLFVLRGRRDWMVHLVQNGHFDIVERLTKWNADTVNQYFELIRDLHQLAIRLHQKNPGSPALQEFEKTVFATDLDEIAKTLTMMQLELIDVPEFQYRARQFGSGIQKAFDDLTSAGVWNASERRLTLIAPEQPRENAVRLQAMERFLLRVTDILNLEVYPIAAQSVEVKVIWDTVSSQGSLSWYNLVARINLIRNTIELIRNAKIDQSQLPGELDSIQYALMGIQEIVLALVAAQKTELSRGDFFVRPLGDNHGKVFFKLNRWRELEAAETVADGRVWAVYLAQKGLSIDEIEAELKKLSDAGRLLEPGQALRERKILATSTEKKRDMVLIIEDEAGISKLYKRIVEASGFQAVTAKNGDEAEDLYRKHHDALFLILSDYNLAGNETGVTVTQKLFGAWHPEHIRLVFITGKSEDVEKALKHDGGPLRVSQILEKPVEFLVLKKMIQDAAGTVVRSEMRPTYALQTVSSGVVADAARLWGGIVYVPALAKRGVINVMNWARSYLKEVFAAPAIRTGIPELDQWLSQANLSAAEREFEVHARVVEPLDAEHTEELVRGLVPVLVTAVNRRAILHLHLDAGQHQNIQKLLQTNSVLKGVKGWRHYLVLDGASAWADLSKTDLRIDRAAVASVYLGDLTDNLRARSRWNLADAKNDITALMADVLGIILTVEKPDFSPPQIQTPGEGIFAQLRSLFATLKTTSTSA